MKWSHGFILGRVEALDSKYLGNTFYIFFFGPMVMRWSHGFMNFLSRNFFSISQDINSKDKEGKTPLMHAAARASRRWVWLDLITLVLNS